MTALSPTLNRHLTRAEPAAAQRVQRELMSLRSPGPSFETSKRVADLAVAMLAVVLLWPLMLGVAVWIKSIDGGPVLYRQRRVGRHGRIFRIYKIRTMRCDAEADGVQFARRGDDRVLTGCRWIRKSHIDELPQLWNILKGDMSVVGPRPERPEVLAEMRTLVPGFERRLAATPGLTGLAQVVNGYSNDTAGMRRKLALDLRYLRRRSLGLDAWLMISTIRRAWDPAAC